MAKDDLGAHGPVLGYILGTIFIIALVVIAWTLGGSWQLNGLLLISGGLIGWIAGVLITPLSAGEKTDFSEYGKAISTFLGGFVVAKLDKLFELSITNSGGAVTELMIGRLLLFVSAFALGALFTFIWRRYISGPIAP